MEEWPRGIIIVSVSVCPACDYVTNMVGAGAVLKNFGMDDRDLILNRS